jgi:hypothetical protein
VNVAASIQYRETRPQFTNPTDMSVMSQPEALPNAELVLPNVDGNVDFETETLPENVVVVGALLSRVLSSVVDDVDGGVPK